jgi:hypothetical protein
VNFVKKAKLNENFEYFFYKDDILIFSAAKFRGGARDTVARKPNLCELTVYWQYV